MNTDTTAAIDRRAAEITAKLAPVHRAITLAARSGLSEPPIPPTEGAGALSALRRAAAAALLGMGSFDDVRAIKAAAATTTARAEKAAAELAQAREIQALGVEGLREIASPLEDALNRLATQRERIERQVMRAGLEQAARHYRESLRAVGKAWAEVLVHADLLSQRERIGTNAATPLAERLSIPVPHLNSFDRLPALPALEAFANCPTPACAVVLGGPIPGLPNGNEIVVDFAAIRDAVRQRLEAELAPHA